MFAKGELFGLGLRGLGRAIPAAGSMAWMAAKRHPKIFVATTIATFAAPFIYKLVRFHV